MFNWNDLRIFLQMVRSGTPIKAAEMLGSDHSTVRRRIAALEEALDAALIIRTGDGYRCTPEGELLLAHALQVERHAQSAESSILGRNASPGGVVRIATPEAFGSLFLAPRLPRLWEAYENIEVHLVTITQPGNLDKREADIAIWLSPPPQQRQFVRRLTSHRLGIYASSSYLDRRPPIKSPNDLDGQPLFGYLPNMPFAQEVALFENTDINVRARFQSSGIISQIKAAEEGGGLCIIPTWLARLSDKLTRVLPDDFNQEREVWIAIHPDLRNVARFRVVYNFIIDQVKNNKEFFLS